MRKIIYFLLLSLLVTVVLDRMVAGILEYVYVHTERGQSGGKLNYVLNQEDNYHTLILGSSRALYHVIPDSIHPNTFNLGWDARQISFQLAVVKILEMQDKLPERIMLHLEEGNYFYLGKSFVFLRSFCLRAK